MKAKLLLCIKGKHKHRIQDPVVGRIYTLVKESPFGYMVKESVNGINMFMTDWFKEIDVETLDPIQSLIYDIE